MTPIRLGYPRAMLKRLFKRGPEPQISVLMVCMGISRPTYECSEFVRDSYRMVQPICTLIGSGMPVRSSR